MKNHIIIDYRYLCEYRQYFVEIGSVMHLILSSKMSQIETGEFIYISNRTTVKRIILIEGSFFLYFTNYDLNQWFDASLTDIIGNENNNESKSIEMCDNV